MTTSTVEKEVITINKVGKFGVLVGEVWYSTNEPLKPTDFVSGQTYNVTVSISKTGKRYIKNMSVTGNVKPVEASPLTTEAKKIVENTFNYEDHQKAKNEQIKRQGTWQAAVQALGLTSNGDIKELAAKVRELAEDGIRFIEGK